MGGATNCPETPRQKMIGMMYIVLTAMLALNVSASILDGFTMVESSLRINTEGSTRRNGTLYDQFNDLNSQNPAKVGEWLKKAQQVKVESDKLFQQIQDLKVEIVKTADGAEGDVENIEARDNLDAAGQICLPENGGKGVVLKQAIEKYRALLSSYVANDPAKVDLINKTFNVTGKVKGHGGEEREWEVATFESMPVAAVVTILSKIQSDVRGLEGEVVTYLKSEVDASDYRVNKIEARVIPNSKYVIRGSKYSAQIVLVAQDTTKQPEVFVSGSLIPEGKYERPATSIGEQKYAGYIKLQTPSGEKQYPFNSDYNVGEPSATISADLMNVFYAGIDNEVSVSVPGVAASSVMATMSGGTLVKKGNGWVATNITGAMVGKECVITVTAKIDDKVQSMGSKAFRVKRLPPPVAFIPYSKDGAPAKYKGGTPGIPKTALLNLTDLKAELDDADIQANFKILSFDLNVAGVMGIRIITSAGANFTNDQTTEIKKMSKGMKFFIGNIKAVGPDGLSVPLKPLEVVVN